MGLRVLVEMLGLNRRPPRNSRQAIGCDGLLYPKLDSSYEYHSTKSESLNATSNLHYLYSMTTRELSSYFNFKVSKPQVHS